MSADIVFTRIDNRLVHGQVGVSWTKAVGANLIVVANDQAAQDPLQQKLMSVTADSSGAGIRFFTIQHTIDIINKAAARQHIFIVVKTPTDARKLIENSVPIKQVNVGNMHPQKGKVEISKKVYIDQQDKDDLLAIANSGVDIFIEDYPGDRKYPITPELLAKA
ncbi:PTS galactosamine transporter subunit IIB [Lactobacillus sp. ESL0701]|uniref:PTS galactosamine transporter subunit IIB n=1 Tax=Lactobacillus sp. ESL0701 TaxID=2983217 RepID=UPI0023F813EF|nr:PTS galactosamine transporter subunit IIB [Lactobacillus sp. ESL0701]MDF7673025.1 PTS galactosamine transporter subunit IIB [Lactobacillus sp. ESL0701]